MNKEALIDRFRRDVDDIVHGDDEEGVDLLYTKQDIEYYLIESQRQFVAGTYYLHGTIREAVVAGSPTVRLGRRILEFRTREAWLENARRTLIERNVHGSTTVEEDYGVSVPVSRFDSRSGPPHYFTADLDADEIRLYPVPEEDDVFVASVYFEAPDTCDLVIRNPRHVNMLLDGMKAMAYRKQDSDAYDPQQAERWQQRFEDNISQVFSERQRRRRKPGVIRYGGI